jgi:hypothetical protein
MTAFADSITSEERAGAHRQFLRRLGIKREHAYYQASPGGGVEVLIWEGADQDSLPELMADFAQNPQPGHERYIVAHVILDLHGAGLSAGPPPMMEKSR